jgi:aromatic-L-amino-acid decarboxylase
MHAMTPEEFRANAHRMVDWMADYLETVEARPVRAPVSPGEVLAGLPDRAPEDAEPFDRIFADFESRIVPGMTHWQHPSFFAYFPANSSPPSVLAEMLTATLGAQCMSWQTSPAATELEQRVMAWLADMIGLPDGFEGVIEDTASTATLCAILSARERAIGFGGNEQGLAVHSPLTVYCSNECHSSIDKGVMVAGIGRDNLRKIAVDEAFAMRPEALDAALTEDVAAGRTPIAVIAAIGTTGSSAIDPLRAIGEICAKHGVWLHVDAAWAGSALILPEHRGMIDGIEFADSFVFNPHKWLFTNFDCSAYFVRDPDTLLRTLSILPEYLKTREGDAVRNYRDWGIQLGRRFRALKLWFVIRTYGVTGLRARIAAHIEMARRLANEIEDSEDFELMAPVPLALLCLRFRPSEIKDPDEIDVLNERLLEAVNDTGRAYLTHTRLAGRYAIRFSIGQTATEWRHVEAAWELLRETARRL